MFDRSIAPVSKIDFNINYPKAITIPFGEKGLLHYINQGTQDIIRIQLLFEAGTVYQSKALIASITNNMLVEGTKKYSSSQIAELFDAEGAFLETDCYAEKAVVSLYCLSRSLAELLAVLKEIIYTATFPEEEVLKSLERRKEKFIVNNKKVGFKAKNNFLRFLLGPNHPYATTINESDFDTLSRKELVDYYQENYINKGFEIFAAGKVDEEAIKTITNCFNSISSQFSPSPVNIDIKDENENKELIIHQNEALQSAIRIGVTTIGKGHSDFPALFVANTILGGYFGSRLMSNIREDKGYTYGIGSALVSNKNCAYFFVSTEVGVEVTEATLREIELEIRNLTLNFVDNAELMLVKNFINGSIVRSFDGAFAAMDRFVSIRTLGLDYSYYDNLLKNIEEIGAESIKEVCSKYLNYEHMKKVIVGKV